MAAVGTRCLGAAGHRAERPEGVGSTPAVGHSPGAVGHSLGVVGHSLGVVGHRGRRAGSSLCPVERERV